ncbi:response regulator [Patescibacteria group bacterium]|nr:response regulator [Patescibacteria group bacterium]
MEKVQTTSKQKNILYVDGDKGIIRKLQDYLEQYEIKGKYGLNFSFAQNAHEALKKITEKKIDLIILEIVLPIINGYYLIKTIKKENIPIIVYTKLRGPEDLARLASSEVENIFLKDLTKIEDLVQALIGKDSYKTDLNKVVIELQTYIKGVLGEESEYSLKVLQCPRCNSILAPNSHFCNNCGQKVFKEKKQIALRAKKDKEKEDAKKKTASPAPKQEAVVAAAGASKEEVDLPKKEEPTEVETSHGASQEEKVKEIKTIKQT